MTLWKLIGMAGTGLFASRWLLQAAASRHAGRSVVPPTFWIASFAGSSLVLLYFSLGPARDIVGFLGNLLPAAVSLYNLSLMRRADRG